jgi:hypothetical protein
MPGLLGAGFLLMAPRLPCAQETSGCGRDGAAARRQRSRDGIHRSAAGWGQIRAERRRGIPRRCGDRQVRSLGPRERQSKRISVLRAAGARRGAGGVWGSINSCGRCWIVPIRCRSRSAGRSSRRRAARRNHAADPFLMGLALLGLLSDAAQGRLSCAWWMRPAGSTTSPLLRSRHGGCRLKES